MFSKTELFLFVILSILQKKKQQQHNMRSANVSDCISCKYLMFLCCGFVREGEIKFAAIFKNRKVMIDFY